jgi:hypothetical protein
LANAAIAAAAGHAAARRAGQAPEAERQAVRAVDLLRRANAAGLFTDAAGVARLKGSDEFTSLRDRPDFQKLLADLEAAKPK